jgi:mRNA interferase MazF
MIRPKRGEIYLVNFDPTLGAEVSKTHPALVVQTDILNSNRFTHTAIVAAITSKQQPARRLKVLIPAEGGTGRTKDSVVLLNQLRSVDRQRLYKRLGRVGEKQMQQIDQALLIVLGLKNL